MRVVVDINHPAHVHYFRNLIRILENDGHSVMVTLSNKDIARQLCDIYGLKYVFLGSYGKGIIRKAINLPILDLRMFLAVRKFDPDVFIGFCSIRAAHVAWFLGKISINLDDTEHAKIGQLLYRPFVTKILTPECFQKDFGKKQIRFKGTTDLLYLHPNRFTPNSSILKEIGLTPDDTYFIVRFISWDANHDIGIKGIGNKVAFVNNLEKHGRVLITSETKLPAELEKNKITISPEKIHDLMYYATLYIGESLTMATESASMGVHAVVINPEAILADGSYTFGVFQCLHDYGLLYAYNNEDDALNKVGELFGLANLKEVGKKKRKKLLLENDDVTDYLVKYVEGYFQRGTK